MTMVHVVTHKENLRPERNPEAVAVVLDILFATSSIAAALQAGALSVVPALDLDEARAIADARGAGECLLAGERDAIAFEGCLSFAPIALLAPELAGRTLVYATTNGTVALRRAERFQTTYAACLRNAPSVARHLLARLLPTQDIVIICAGSRGRFSLEDFYGAGYLVQCLHRLGSGLALSDTAVAAELSFAGTNAYDVISQSRVGRLMARQGLELDIAFASELDSSAVVPLVHEGRIRDVGARSADRG